ncbi:MAG: hypothetical protein RLY86_1503 [Pseudomonadota bacterium]|jgi:GMP synthase (glutamine-hydrolysing)
MNARLPTHLYVQSHLWRCSADGIPVYVLRKGERESGLIILKVAGPGGSRLFTQGRDLSGRLGWVPALNGQAVDEPAAAAYVDRQVRIDPDLWVIEVESRDGSHPFSEP